MPQEKFEEQKSLNGTNEGVSSNTRSILEETWGPREMTRGNKSGQEAQLAGPPADSHQEPSAQRPQEFPQGPDWKAGTQGSPESQESPPQQQKPKDSPANQGPADATKDDAKPTTPEEIDWTKVPNIYLP